MKTIEPGDRLVITKAPKEYKPLLYLVGIASSLEWFDGRQKIDFVVDGMTTNGCFFLDEYEFEVVEVYDAIPERGDKIIIVNPDLFKSIGRIFEVYIIENDKTYVIDGNGWWFKRGSYEILARQQKSDVAVCPDCKGTGKIELLTSVVECECRG